MADMASNKKFKSPKLSARKLRDMTAKQICSLLPAGGLDNGGHSQPGSDLNTIGQVCLMEAVAYITGEPHSDHPKCADPVLTSIGINFNDSHDHRDAERNKLVDAIPALVGSRTASKRIRFRRAKAAAKLLVEKTLEKLSDDIDEGVALSLIERIKGNPFKTLDDVRAVLNDLELFEVEDETFVYIAVDALRTLVLHWDSKGISNSTYQKVFRNDDLTDLFETGEEQATFLRSVASIRS